MLCVKKHGILPRKGMKIIQEVLKQSLIKSIPSKILNHFPNKPSLPGILINQKDRHPKQYLIKPIVSKDL